MKDDMELLANAQVQIRDGETEIEEGALKRPALWRARKRGSSRPTPRWSHSRVEIATGIRCAHAEVHSVRARVEHYRDAPKPETEEKEPE